MKRSGVSHIHVYHSKFLEFLHNVFNCLSIFLPIKVKPIIHFLDSGSDSLFTKYHNKESVSKAVSIQT